MGCGDGRVMRNMLTRLGFVRHRKNLRYLATSCHQFTRDFMHFSPPSGKTHYETLGVPRTASKREIKAAFFNLSKKLHPDVNRVQISAEPFREVNEAYRTLINSKTRAQYDLKLHTGGTYISRKSSFEGANVWSNFDSEQQFYTHSHKHSEHRQSYSHSRVVYALVGITIVASAVHTYRIIWYHKRFQIRNEEESRRNSLIYSEVREQAMNSTMQEQLDALVQKRAHALENQRKAKQSDT